MAEWRYVKSITNINLIKEAETRLGYRFSDEYVAFLKQYNGGRPPVSIFDTDRTKERTIKSFLSVNPSDSENIIKANQIVSKIRDDAVAFGIDNFGNYICFDKHGDGIMFFDFETETIEKVTSNFDEFFKIVNG